LTILKNLNICSLNNTASSLLIIPGCNNETAEYQRQVEDLKNNQKIGQIIHKGMTFKIMAEISNNNSQKAVE
jgi:hypothetical protein